MHLSLILLLLMGESCVTVCGICEYHYITEEKNWTEAQLYCREKHTDLVTVTDMADMNRLLSNSPANMSQAWIGLYNPVQGDWSWYWSLPGEEYKDNETNWKAVEPYWYPEKTKYSKYWFVLCGLITDSLQWEVYSGKFIGHCTYPRHFLCYNGNGTSQKYFLIKEKKTFLDAQSYCRENHTDLVSGLKQLKDPLLNQTVLSDYNRTQSTYIYIGLFRDNWRWSDGNSSSFRHWNLQFNMDRMNSGQCAMIVSDDGGRWKNDDCAERKPFICYDDKLILIKENKTWEEALIYCRDHHHDLVTITNIPEQQKWVLQKVKQASSPFVWIGLRYNCPRDIWFWVCKRENMSRASGRSTDDCNLSGAIEADGEHRWFERNASETHNFICSKA